MFPDGVKTILIIDDDVSVRQSLGAYLEDYDYLVTAADSAEAGISELRQSKFDLAIVDLRLPGKNGSEFIEEAAAIDDDIRFLIHTGSTNFLLTESLIRKGIGPKQVFAKPLKDMAPLLDCIRAMR